MVEEEQLECGICLDKISERGSLNVCEHAFCFSCVSKWAKLSNTCPVCKRRFTRLTKQELYDTSSGATPKKRKRPKRVKTETVSYKDQSEQNHYDPEDAGPRERYITFLRRIARNFTMPGGMVFSGNIIRSSGGRPGNVIDLTSDPNEPQPETTQEIYDLTGEETHRRVRRRLNSTEPPVPVIEIDDDYNPRDHVSLSSEDEGEEGEDVQQTQ